MRPLRSTRRLTASLVTAVLLASACDEPPAPPTDEAAAGSAPRAAAPAPLASVQPEALAELLAAAPRAPLPPTGSAGTLVGAAPSATAAPASAPLDPLMLAPRPRVDLGEAVLEPGLSSASLERAARAQLYWDLTQRCRDAQGGLLPAEAVHLDFVIDPDGYIAPATILASAKDPRHDAAAQCMRRVLSALPFRAPAQGTPTHVKADVPSID